MLGFLRRGQRWLTAAIVFGIGGVFVFFMGLGGPMTGPSAGVLVEVGPYRFGIREFEQEREFRESRIQETLGDAFDARAMSDTLDQLTARALVERAVLAVDAEAQGLTVARKEVERAVLDAGAFRDDSGRFDREAFSGWVEWRYGSERNFMRDQRMRLLASKLRRLLYQSASVSEGEARQALRQRLEEIRIAFAVFDEEGGEAAEAAVDPGRLSQVLETRDDELRQLYDERISEFDTPEQVRARHILFQVDPDEGEEALEQARRDALAGRQRLSDGEDFAELARELSDDTGTREQGGDLGFFRRGRMVKSFEEAAFSLEPGATSDPVRSDFGFHVIRVEERRDAVQRSFEAVREQLAGDLLRREAGREAARALAEKVAARVAGGEDLEDATRAQERTLERSGWVRRRPDGFVPGLGAAQEMLSTAFGLDPGESSPRIFQVGKKLALVKLVERREPDAAQVEEQLDAERERLLQQKRGAQLESWLQARRQALASSGQLAVNLEPLQR